MYRLDKQNQIKNTIDTLDVYDHSTDDDQFDQIIKFLQSKQENILRSSIDDYHATIDTQSKRITLKIASTKIIKYWSERS